MSREDLIRYSEIARQVIGDLDIIADEAEPWPWFCKDIKRKRDLQWAGYIGDINHATNALAFGLNLEFTPAWRKVYSIIADDLRQFSELLKKLQIFEWHWQGRPAIIAKNPGVRILTIPMPASEVDIDQWINELEDILDHKIMWSAKAPMRPQIQIVRFVGKSVDIIKDRPIIENIEECVSSLKPIVDFLQS